MSRSTMPTILIVPGLRDDVPEHWQTVLAERLDTVQTVPVRGRHCLDCHRRVDDIDAAVQAIAGPVVIVAHSGGIIAVAHWAQRSARPVQGALLAAPPDFDTPMPQPYPDMEALRAGGWFPVPLGPLPFPSIAALSRNDPLGRFDRIEALARGWGSRIADLGAVGHLNPASGYGDWPAAESFIAELSAISSYCRLKGRLKP